MTASTQDVNYIMMKKEKTSLGNAPAPGTQFIINTINICKRDGTGGRTNVNHVQWKRSVAEQDQ